MFGVCTNEYAPDDGRVVAADHGCGAHSEAAVMPPSVDQALPILDELSFDMMEEEAGSVDEAASEELGHS
jgi:hypothetical protein